MKKLLLAAVVVLLGSLSLRADIYGPGPGGPVPDGSSLTSPILISHSTPRMATSLNSVTVFFSVPHTYLGDLSITLTAPNGDDVQLIRRVGATSSTSFGDSSDFAGPYVFVNSGGGSFADAAALALFDEAVAPGTYNRSSASLQTTPAADPDDYSVFFMNKINGTWTLTVSDWAGGDVGTLGHWFIDITSVVPEPSSLALSGLALALGLGLVAKRRRKG